MKEPNFPEEFENTGIVDEQEIPTEELLAEVDELMEEAAAEDALPEEVVPSEEPFHEDLTNPDTREELMAADHAMYSAGLQHPEDAEFLYDEEVFTEEDFAEPEEAPVPDIVPEPAETPAPAKKERPVRKGRPKRKKGPGLFGIPHILATVIWLMIVVAIGTTLGRFLWVCAADVLAFGRD